VDSIPSGFSGNPIVDLMNYWIFSPKEELDPDIGSA